MESRKHDNAIRAFNRHNATYKALKARKTERKEINQADLETLHREAEHLGRLIRAGAPKDSIVKYGSRVRYMAERLGVMIHIPVMQTND